MITRNEQVDSSSDVVGLLQVEIGQVRRSKNGTAIISIENAQELLERIQKVARAINNEIQDQIPILGNNENPHAFIEITEQSLMELNNVLASRTQERLQLTIVETNTPQ